MEKTAGVVHEAASALTAVLGGWVCRKDAFSRPALLTNADILNLAQATHAALSAPVSADGEREWGNLREMTKNWLVQQGPNSASQPLQLQDFRRMTELLSSETGQNVPDPTALLPSSSELCAEGAGLGYTKTDLAFALEHLEHCL